MEDQNRIATGLASQRRYQAENTFARDAEALRRSLLAQAFRGEL